MGRRPTTPAARPTPGGKPGLQPGRPPVSEGERVPLRPLRRPPALAIDGKVNFLPTPVNRWTSYESPDPTDWLEIDFGAPKAFARVELAIYDDRGGVQPPTRYDVEFWDGAAWQPVAGVRKSPEAPTGSVFNEARFDRVRASKLRVVFTHSGRSRSGVSEVYVWDR